jgi:hypothetical protein
MVAKNSLLRIMAASCLVDGPICRRVVRSRRSRRLISRAIVPDRRLKIVSEEP